MLARLDDSQPRRRAGAAPKRRPSGARKAARKTKSRLDEAGSHSAASAQLFAEQRRRSQSEVDEAQAHGRLVRRRAIAARRAGAGRRAPDRRAASTDLDNTIIRAPFSGIAISKDAQPGEMVSPVSAGGGFTRTGICTIVDMRRSRSRSTSTRATSTACTPGQQVDGRARRVSGLADPGARHHHRADRRSAEGHRAGAHRLQGSSIRASCPTWASRSRSCARTRRRRGAARGGAAARCAEGGAAPRTKQAVRRVRRARRPGRAARRQDRRRRRRSRRSLSGLRSRRTGRVPTSRDAQGRRRGVTRSSESAVGVERMPSFACSDVHKIFTRGSERIDVLKGVNLDIPRGDFLALMGPSGSGKTTLLNLIGGLDAPTERRRSRSAAIASSALGGGELSRWRAQHIGFVFQFYNLLPVLTAERNVELPLLLTKLSKAERRKRVGDRAEGRRPRRPRQALPAPAVRRTGAARRHRPRDRHRSDAAAVRRADRRSRSQGRRRDPRPAAGAQPRARQDHRHGHARSARGGARQADAAPREGHAARARRSHEIPAARLAQPAGAARSARSSRCCRSSSRSCCSAC